MKESLFLTRCLGVAELEKNFFLLAEKSFGTIIFCQV